METIGQRIKRLRLEYSPKLTQKQLAHMLGVAAPSLSAWENDESEPRGENLIKLAHALRKSPEEIRGMKKRVTYATGGKNVGGIAEPLATYHKVPVISSVQAGDWSEATDPYALGNAESWQETTANVSEHAFALRVQGRSMQNPNGSPSIPDGAIVIVDPATTPTSGKIVVAKLLDSNEVTIKKLVTDGPNRYLEPLNPDYKPITINGDCVIVGVVRQVIQDL